LLNAFFFLLDLIFYPKIFPINGKYKKANFISTQPKKEQKQQNI